MTEYLNTENLIEIKEYFNRNILLLTNEVNSTDLRLGSLGNIKIYEIKGWVASYVN